MSDGLFLLVTSVGGDDVLVSIADVVTVQSVANTTTIALRAGGVNPIREEVADVVSALSEAGVTVASARPEGL